MAGKKKPQRQHATKPAKKKARKATRTKEEEQMRPDKFGQSWSVDLIIGVIIFMLIVAVFYALITAKTKPEFEELQEDARSVVAKVETAPDDSFGLIKAGQIDPARLQELCDMPYDQLKAELGIENDICIYLEDQNGNIIPCGTGNKTGIGNGVDLHISQTYACGQATT